MSSKCRIAIVGGGLAGLAAANALRKFAIEPEIFEAAPALGEIGAAVNTSPQAVKALQAIGVGDEIAAVGWASPGDWVWGYDPVGDWDKAPVVPAAYAA